MRILAVLALTALAIPLTYFDLTARRLPDVLTLPAYPLFAAPLVLVAGTPGPLVRAALAAGACLLGYGLLAAAGAVGFGDVKLAGLLGLVLGWFSWRAAAIGVVLAFTAGAVWGLAARRAEIPFGPAMLLGAITALLVT